MGVVGVVLGALGLNGAAMPAQAAAAPPTRPTAGAAMIGWHEDGDDVDALRANEAVLGTRFALVRMYQQWKVPSRRVAAMIAEGRLVLVSHKPPAIGGWAAVASGAEDAMIGALADAYRAFDREVLFSFHHEPHDDASDVKGGTAGTSAEYLAAWRRIRSVFDTRGASHTTGGNVFFAYSATGSWALAAAKGAPPGSGDPLYPGDDLVDVFAHDRYNWASCRGDAWEEFAAEWAPLVALAAAHRKPLLAAEFGSPPNGGARNDWFRRAAAWLRTDPAARQWMWGFAYYHSLHDTCPWDFLNQGDDGRLGWQDAFRDPYFTGTPFSLRSAASAPGPVVVSPTPPPTPPSTVTKSGTTPQPTTTATTRPTTTTTTATGPSSGAGGANGPPADSAGPGGTPAGDAAPTADPPAPSHPDTTAASPPTPADRPAVPSAQHRPWRASAGALTALAALGLIAVSLFRRITA